jgi:hypothetical protein
MTMRHAFLDIIIVASMISLSASGASGLPAITTTYPADGQLLLSNMVNVTGTAEGSDDDWAQTTADDFAAGDTDFVVVNETGKLTLGRTVYDDFNDNSLDTGKWTPAADTGLSVIEQGQKLQLGGAAASSGWSAASVRSKGFVSYDVEANLTAFSGSGDGWATGLGFYQDDQNSININEHYDWTWNYIQLTISSRLGGTNSEAHLQNLGGNPAPRNFRIRYSAGTVYFYMDGSQVYSQNANLQSPLIQLYISAVNRARIDARWDDVTAQTPAGIFKSSIYDSRSTYPVLTNVAWNGTAPTGTKVTVSIRSGDRPDLSDATAWTPVSAGQSSGLPAAKRYLQYMVRLEWTDSKDPPELRDITISYHKPVARVDVSVDQQNWILATGTDTWRASLQVPEDAAFIYSRVTDVAGDTALGTVRIMVDTTPPVGNITINNGDWATLRPKVSLALNATDRYGVSKMMVSESPEFAGTSWVDCRQSLNWTLSGGDGPKTVYARFRDANGWESATVSASIILDTTPPAGSIIIDGGARYTNSTLAKLSINASDLLGVTRMLLSSTEDFALAEWIPFSESIDWALLAGNGERTVYAMFQNPMGQESAIVSDSIILDTQPPSAVLSINNGAPFTNSRQVSARLNASDNNVVESMEISEDPGLAGASLEPYQADSYWTLSQTEGEHTLYARVWDNARNPGAVVSASITLDLTPPTAHIGVPSSIGQYDIGVDHGASDNISGLEYYDIEYRDGTGGWTPWLTHVSFNDTTANSVFTGQDGHTYSFRIRAMDNAGNLGQFVEANNTATVNIPAPAVTITEPFANSTIRGALQIKGTAYPRTGPAVIQVFVRLDGGDWELANGTGQWTFEIQSRGLKNGPHTVTARSYDGLKYSGEVDRAFIVKNPAPEPALVIGDNFIWVIVLILILSGALALALYRSARKKRERGMKD